MADGITISSGSKAFEGLRRTFEMYAAWNGREGEPLFLDQGRKLANELYNQTAAIAPTKAEIASDVRKLGWRIPGRFPDGRSGRGSPSQWMGAAWSKRKKKRGRGAGDANQRARELFMSQRPTLAQMQAFVIKQRGNARLYLASGWLGAIDDLGGKLKATSGKVDRARGGADIIRRKGLIQFRFWNKTPGIAKMNAKHNFVAKAVAIRTADMLVYIRRKQQESLKKAA